MDKRHEKNWRRVTNAGDRVDQEGQTVMRLQLTRRRRLEAFTRGGNNFVFNVLLYLEPVQ